MVSLNYQLIRQKLDHLSSVSFLAVSSILLLTTTYGCSQKAQDEAQLEIKIVQAAQISGVYNVVGNTTLPDSSRIAVSAVRNLRTVTGQSVSLQDSDQSNRSILARQIVEVKQGKWQADLNIWQVAPNGKIQEVWQANQGQTKLTADGDVTFIATFDPSREWELSDSQKPQKQKVESQKLEGKLLRFTNEGERYLQASQSLSISLPEGKTAPPRLQPEEINDGWGNRYQIPPEPLETKVNLLPPAKRQSNTPLSTSEFLR
jgi:hypothetical protein